MKSKRLSTIEISIVSRVAEDIIKVKFKNKDTLGKVLNNFYKIMRKHGIKKGTKEGNGVVMSNFEWTMCKELYFSMLISHFNIQSIMFNVPKDLRHY